MTDDLGDRAWAVFEQLEDIPTERREPFLRAACRDDAALRSEVDRLLALGDRLASDGGPAAFLRSPLIRPPSRGGAASEPALSSQGKPGLPDHVGHYRVLRLLGEGGMGAVYEAEQDSPHRTVALKVIRPGLLSTAFLKRFAQEVKILGRLHHPGIAQIYEAGVAEDGQPFFAMEFVRGLPLDEYDRLQALTLSARIGLFTRVCDAVQHAHDRGVIHRDLKPANMLVEETGEPKVLDFGVARATDADLLARADLTQAGQLLGTPSYMSPEQMAADPAAIDHRADVYALGVILFELLAHQPPYPLENRPLAEAARLILEQDPPRLGSIRAELRGDVETIVAKALEKDPARRYQQAADLAADLRRWLAHEPILARLPSALYHLLKFARRHTGLVGGVAATVAALVLGLAGTISFAVREAHERGRAEQNARQAIDKEREALFQAYRARLAAAVAALQNPDVHDAARQLSAAPEDLRDWEWRHLQSRLDDSTSVIPLHAQEAGLLLGASDRLQVWALTSAGLRLTDLGSCEQKAVGRIGKSVLQERQERPYPVSLAQARRGLRVAVWVSNTAFELLDEAGRVVCRVDVPQTTEPRHVALSPDGTRLACAWSEGDSSPFAVYDAMTGKQTAVCSGPRWGIQLAVSPDGARLVSSGEDQLARLWDAATGALLSRCRGHESKINSAAFRPDGARLVTASSDGTVRQWDVATGREVEPAYDRHSGEVTAAVYGPDGQWVASAGTDRTIRVWRATGRQDVAALHGHRGAVTGVAFAADGRRLASFSSEAALWRGDGTVRVWDVDPRATLPVLRGHTSFVYPVAFSPDGRWIASGGWDNTVRLWEAATGETCATLPHPGIVPCLAYSPDGTWLVSGGDRDARLRIWDMTTARVRKEIQGPAGTLRFLTVSPDGRRVAATASGAQLKYHLQVCDVASGERLFSAEGGALAYSPDGRWLTIRAADEKTVLLVDAWTHETVARLEGHEKFVYGATFSHDSRRLATCSGDHTVRLWQTDSGACQVLSGHTDEVFAAAFHPDPGAPGRLATAGRDRAIWLWDLTRGEEVARLPGHTSYVWSLAFSPDGTTLVSGSGDSTVRLWDTAPLTERYRARREAAALRPEAERIVDELWRQKKDPAEIVETLQANLALSEPQRHAARIEVLRRATSPNPAPGNPPGRP
jgi:WD40 repeat protein